MKKIILIILFWSASANAQYKTEWQKMNVATTASFRGLSTVNENVVWASGTESTIIRTVDGGEHWSVMHVPGAEQLDFRGITAFDESNAVIVSSGPAKKGQARIYRTVDGGATWTLVYEDKRAGVFFDAIAFWDHEHGIVLSDPVEGKFALFSTENGGGSWKQVPASALPPALPKEGAFAASNSCLTVYGKSHVWFATGGATVARVFRSGDRGKTWEVTDTPMHPENSSSGIFSLVFHDDKRGVAVGGDYAHPEGSALPNVVTTIDGGKTWRTGGPTKPPGMYLSSVIFEKDSGPVIPSHTGSLVAAGPGGVIYASPGYSWSRKDAISINTVAYPAWNQFWAVGPGGAVYRRTRYEAYASFFPTGGTYALPLSTTQVVVVVASDWNATSGKLTRYERGAAADPWTMVGPPVPVSLGKNGLALFGSTSPMDGSEPRKQEGDGRSPAAMFRISPVFAKSASLDPTRLNGLECVDDPNSFSYGASLKPDEVAFADWATAQPIANYGPAIAIPVADALGLWRLHRDVLKPLAAVDAEKKSAPPGSCFFLFGSKTPRATDGSTAIAAQDFDELLRWLDERRSPVLIQLPRDQYERLHSSFHLP